MPLCIVHTYAPILEPISCIQHQLSSMFFSRHTIVSVATGHHAPYGDGQCTQPGRKALPFFIKEGSILSTIDVLLLFYLLLLF